MGVAVIGVVTVVLLRPRPVAVQPTSPAGAAARACAALAHRLPDQVAGGQRRPTLPDPSDTAAWGTTPILLRCGVPRPAALESTSQLTTVDGVDWFAEQLTHGVRFTTTGRDAYVEVTVPDADAPEAGVLGDLAQAIRSSVPTVS